MAKKKGRGAPRKKPGVGKVSYPGEPVWRADEDAPEAPSTAELAPETGPGIEEDLAEQLEHNVGDRQDDEAHLMPEGDESPGELHLGDENPRPWLGARGRRKTKGERS
jgi:hypothetical protein